MLLNKILLQLFTFTHKSISIALGSAGLHGFAEKNQRFIGRWTPLLPRSFAAEVPWVFDRTACLGSDVLKLAFPKLRGSRRFHLQKVRIDALADRIQPGFFRRRNLVGMHVRRAIVREDVWDLVYQQNSHIVGRNPSAPRFCLIDSYSELTDQRFVDTVSGSHFYANFSDVSREALEEGFVTCEGLIDLDDAKANFEDLFLKMENLWGPVPIFLLTYPRDLERRQKFLARGEQLQRIFQFLASTHPNVHLIAEPAGTVKADDKEIARGEVFPYHYSDRVKEELALELLRMCHAVGVQYP